MNAIKKRKMAGRPRSFDVDLAVETAMHLFHARGCDAVGVAEISSALGINPPSFYSAFGSKAELFERALARFAESDANVFARALDEGGNVAQVIERTFANAAKCFVGSTGPPGCLILDGSRNSSDPQVRAIGEQARKATVAAVREFVARERPDRASELARFVVTALAGMSAAARDGATTDDLKSYGQWISRAFAQELCLETKDQRVRSSVRSDGAG